MLCFDGSEIHFDESKMTFWTMSSFGEAEIFAANAKFIRATIPENFQKTIILAFEIIVQPLVQILLIFIAFPSIFS